MRVSNGDEVICRQISSCNYSVIDKCCVFIVAGVDVSHATLSPADPYHHRCSVLFQRSSATNTYTCDLMMLILM